MKRSLILAVPVLALGFIAGAVARPAFKAEPQLAHMVFFTLKSHTPEAVEKFVGSCQKHLSGHEGVDYFSVGTRAADVEEPVSVKDFDVALHIVFKNKGARDKYLVHERHVKFVDENKADFAKVRVFDTYIDAAK